MELLGAPFNKKGSKKGYKTIIIVKLVLTEIILTNVRDRVLVQADLLK